MAVLAMSSLLISLLARVGFVLLLGVLVVPISAVFFYFWDPKSLRKLPAPSWVAAYHNYHLQQYDAIHRAHQRLGTHVRISPNHVSITAPDAVDAIYGHGANFLKDVWYDGGAGDDRTMADTRSKAEHRGKRKTMAHLFSQKSIAELEPVIVDRVRALLAAADRAADHGAPHGWNVRRFVNYFTIDVITAVLFGVPAGCLEQGHDVVPAKDAATGRVYQAPLIDALHDSMRVSVPIGYSPATMPLTRTLVRLLPMYRSGARFADIVYYHVTEAYTRLERGEKAGQADKAEKGCFLRQIMYGKGGSSSSSGSNGGGGGVPMAELIAECSGMINAGSDTTSTGLSNVVYLLTQAKHRRILERLRGELDPVFAAAESEPPHEADARSPTIPSFDRLAALPFLRACIDETLRLRPSSAFGLPREVPAGGRWIAGQFVAAGVSVSVPTYSLLHHEGLFPLPDEYRPERWVDAVDTAEAAAAKKYFLPFSTGPRACIGRNIAYFEMTLVVAVLVHYFDFAFADAAVTDGHYRVLERLNANPDELYVTVQRRAAAWGA